jgi:hypothetical protein
MQSLIEIIGSTIIGGMLLLLILTSKINVTKASNSQLMNSNLQSNLTTIADVIESDVKNIGYRIPSGGSILTASQNKFTFKFDTTGTPTIITYNYQGNKLQRIFNGTPGNINLGVSSFKVWYYKFNGDTTSDTTYGVIKSFKIAVTVQDTFRYDGDSLISRWEKTFKPQNL